MKSLGGIPGEEIYHAELPTSLGDIVQGSTSPPALLTDVEEWFN